MNVEDPDWPFDGISKHTILLNANDMSTLMKGLPGSAWLNLTEGQSNFVCRQKGKTAVTIPDGFQLVCCSYNALAKSAQFSQENIDAFQGADGREFKGGVTWTRKDLPFKKTRLSERPCPRCSHQFFEWCRPVGGPYDDTFDAPQIDPDEDFAWRELAAMQSQFL